MIETVYIPLTENPTRQKIWRVVVFVAPLVLAAGISATLFRAVLAVDTLSAFAPANTELSVRLIKTAESSAVLEDKFHGTLLFPNAPFTLDELSRWSKRGSAVFIGETGVIGAAVSGKVPQSTLDEAEKRGLIVAKRFGGTYIGTEKPASTKFALRFTLFSLLPWHNGEAYSVKAHKGVPLNLTANSLTIGMGRTKSGNDVLTDEKLTKIAVSPEEAKNLISFDVPLVFPGLRALETQMIEHGFSLSLGADDEGTPYAINVPGGNLTKEDLENVVSELYYTKSLSTNPVEDVYTSMDEIISTSVAKPVTTSDPAATITSITDNGGNIVRAAQTPHSLVLTNRPTDIGGATSSKASKNSCLRTANQWISTDGLGNLLPARLSTPGWTFVQKLLSSDQIAFSKHRTRICW
jgi:hypothetical protein